MFNASHSYVPSHTLWTHHINNLKELFYCVRVYVWFGRRRQKMSETRARERKAEPVHESGSMERENMRKIEEERERERKKMGRGRKNGKGAQEQGQNRMHQSRYNNRLTEQLRLLLVSMKLDWNLARAIKPVKIVKIEVLWSERAKMKIIRKMRSTTTITAAAVKCKYVEAKYECSGCWVGLISFGRHLWTD